MPIKVSFGESLLTNASEIKQNPRVTYPKTDTYSTDTVELSTKKDENQEVLYLKMAAGAASLITVIGSIIYYRHGRVPNKLTQNIERKVNRAEETIEELVQNTERNINIPAGEKASEIKIETVLPQPKAEEVKVETILPQPKVEEIKTEVAPQQPKAEEVKVETVPPQAKVEEIKTETVQPQLEIEEVKNETVLPQPKVEEIKTNPAPEQPKIEAVKPESVSAQPRAEVKKGELLQEKPKVAQEIEEAADTDPKARSVEEMLHAEQVDSVNGFLQIHIGVKDDDLAELLLSKYANALDYLGSRKGRNFEYNFLTEIIEKSTNPLEKEKWLTKQVKLAINGVQQFNQEEKMEQLYGLRSQLEELYRTEGVDFKYKDSADVDIITDKLNDIYKSTRKAKKLKEFLGFETDYDFFKILLQKAKEYTNLKQLKSNPMSNLGYESVSAKSPVNIFLQDILPELIKEDVSLLKQEKLYIGYLNVIKRVNKGNEFTNSTFDILREMYEKLYKDEANLSAGLNFNYKSEVFDRLNGLMDEFIFNKFKIWGVSNFNDKLELSKQVINRSNMSGSLMEPKDVKYVHITEALLGMAEKQNKPTYYMSAVDLAKVIDAKNHAIELIDRILGNKNLSDEYKLQFTDMRNDFVTQYGKVMQNISEKFSTKSYEEALDSLEAAPEFEKALYSIMIKDRLSGITELKKAVKNGDYNSIYRILLHMDNLISKIEDFTQKSLSRDIIIDYLGKINKVVKDSNELEFLKNFRIYELGQQIQLYKQLNPDIATAYNELLKTDLKDILYSKDIMGNVHNVKNFEDYLVKNLADKISDIMTNSEPDKTVLTVLEVVLEKQGEFMKKNNISAYNAIISKINEINEKLSVA